VLDRIDIVVRRRRNECDSRDRVAEPGDEGRDFIRWNLATLPRLRPLGDLDLDLRRRRQIRRGDTETSRSHLFHGAVAFGAEAGRVLAALARAGARPD